MHRVELKVGFLLGFLLGLGVPNAPCGVESYKLKENFWQKLLFLMHRVELKVKVLINLKSWVYGS